MSRKALASPFTTVGHGLIRLRAPRLDDIPQLLSLEERCFTDYYESHRFDEAHFRYYLEKPQTLAFVATSDVEIVGYVLGIVYGGRRSHVARVQSVAVDPGSRRSRIGFRLMTSFIQAAKARSCRRILLESATVNGGGIALFELLGFRRQRSLPNHYGEGVDGVRMRREL